MKIGLGRYNLILFCGLFCALSLHAVEPSKPQTVAKSCADYLAQNPPLQQCGDTCSTYSVTQLLSAHAGEAQSVELVLLDLLVNDLEQILHMPPAQRDFTVYRSWLKGQDGIKTPMDALLVAAEYGTLPRSQFPSLADSKSFMKTVGLPLSVPGILELRRLFATQFKVVARACQGGYEALCHEYTEQLMARVQAVIAFQRTIRPLGIDYWQRNFASLKFKMYLSTALAKTPESDVRALLAKWIQDFAVQLHLQYSVVSPEELQTVFSQVSAHKLPMTLGLKPLALGAWQDSGHAVLAQAQDGMTLVIHDSNPQGPEMIQHPILGALSTGSVKLYPLKQIVPYIDLILSTEQD